MDLSVRLDHLLATVLKAEYIGLHTFSSIQSGATRALRDDAYMLVCLNGGDGWLEPTRPDVRLVPGWLTVGRPARGERLHLGDAAEGYVSEWYLSGDGLAHASDEEAWFASTPVPGYAVDLCGIGHAERPQKDDFRTERLRALYSLLLTDMLRMHHRRFGDDGVRTLSAEQCQTIARIADRYAAERYDSQRLADALGLSREYFAKLLRNTYGVGAREWIVYQRMRRAANLLQKTTLPVGEIACQLGYDNPSLLCRQFRKWYGKTPLQFRAHPGHAQVDLWGRTMGDISGKSQNST